MKNTSNKLLLVEGYGDKHFIEQFLQFEQLNLSLNIQVVLPAELALTTPNTAVRIQNSKQGIMNVLGYAIEDLPQGRYTHIGALMDMDFHQSPKRTIQQQNIDQLSDVCEQYGFRLRQPVEPSHGLVFEHIDFNPIGVWLMPNNQDEGYLETWLKLTLNPNQLTQWQQIEQFIESFDKEHFKPQAFDKAKVYTWLATQSKPTQDISKALNLVNQDNIIYQNFKNWLITTFQ
ncbi:MULTISPECIES: DUF3226 domain-containing protein [unclassified Moraxella]|uniref:DUF3226 domain-containing protein n=1 Tax=unclassified Moraxella TaxID=2685852 RepID=UPI003AF9BF30